MLTLFPTAYFIHRCHGRVDSTPPMKNTLRVVFVQFLLTQLNLYIIVGNMQKETVRSSKLKELRNFEILVWNWGKKSGRKKKLITRSNLNILNSFFCKHPHFTSTKRICNFQKISIFSKGPEGGTPPKNIPFFWFLNQVNIYLGKVQKFVAYLLPIIGGNQEFH